MLKLNVPVDMLIGDIEDEGVARLVVVELDMDVAPMLVVTALEVLNCSALIDDDEGTIEVVVLLEVLVKRDDELLIGDDVEIDIDAVVVPVDIMLELVV